jgi:hypothetical protein
MGIAPDYAGAMLPSQLIGGAGVGLVLPTLSAAATGPLPAARFATGTAVLGMSRQLGSVLGVAALVAIVGTPAPAAAVSAFAGGWTFMVIAAGCAGAVLLAVGPVRIGGASADDQRSAPGPETAAPVLAPELSAA